MCTPVSNVEDLKHLGCVGLGCECGCNTCLSVKSGKCERCGCATGPGDPRCLICIAKDLGITND